MCVIAVSRHILDLWCVCTKTLNGDYPGNVWELKPGMSYHYKVSNIIIRLTDNRKLLLICILLLLHSLIFFRFIFYKNMVVIYVFLLEEAMYSYRYLCILIVSLCYSCLYVVYVFLDAATLTEVFPCIFLSCKANARVNLAKTGHAPHSSQLLCCSMYCLFCVVLCIVCV